MEKKELGDRIGGKESCGEEGREGGAALERSGHIDRLDRIL
jgi:hypothetical protein